MSSNSPITATLLVCVLAAPCLGQGKTKKDATPPSPKAGDGKAGKKGEPSKAKKDAKKPEKAALMDALEVMRLRKLRSLPQDETAELDIRVEEKGRITDKRRELVRSILRKDGLERSLLRFTSPPGVRGTAVLTIEKTDGADDQWIYTPEIRKPKRTTRAQSTEFFAGSGFTFEDLRAEDLNAHEYKTIAKKKIQKRWAWVIDVRPKKEMVRALKGYAKRYLYVDAERYVTMKVEFYDHADKLIKTQENSRWKAVGGVYRPYRVLMKEFLRERKTYIKFRSWAANEGIPESLFTTRELMKP